MGYIQKDIHKYTCSVWLYPFHFDGLSMYFHYCYSYLQVEYQILLVLYDINNYIQLTDYSIHSQLCTNLGTVVYPRVIPLNDRSLHLNLQKLVSQPASICTTMMV